ncbi:MAG: hypothetical protein ACI304_04650 [Lepagella sp.]
MTKKCFTLLLATVMMAVMSSCRPSVEDVVDKIVEKQELTSAEYEVIIDYTLEGLNEISDSVQVYKDSPTDLLRCMMRMSQRYEYNNVVIGKLMEVDAATLEEPVRAKYEKAMTLYAENEKALKSVMKGSMITPEDMERGMNREVTEEEVSDTTASAAPKKEEVLNAADQASPGSVSAKATKDKK